MKFREDGDVNFQLGRMLNGGLEFEDNIRGALLEARMVNGFAAVRHGLGYVPTGYLVLMKDNEGDVWAARLSEWSRETLFLESNVSNLRVRLFVM